jgi:hypothetical protein
MASWSARQTTRQHRRILFREELSVVYKYIWREKEFSFAAGFGFGSRKKLPPGPCFAILSRKPGENVSDDDVMASRELYQAATSSLTIEGCSGHHKMDRQKHPDPESALVPREAHGSF